MSCITVPTGPRRDRSQHFRAGWGIEAALVCTYTGSEDSPGKQKRTACESLGSEAEAQRDGDPRALSMTTIRPFSLFLHRDPVPRGGVGGRSVGSW